MVPEKLTRRKVRKRKEEDPIMARRTQTHWSTNLFRIRMIAEYSIHLSYHSLQMYSPSPRRSPEFVLNSTILCCKSSSLFYFINLALGFFSGLFILRPIAISLNNVGKILLESFLRKKLLVIVHETKWRKQVKVKLHQVVVGFGYDSFTKICAGRKCTAAHIIKIHGGQRTTSSWGQKCKSLKNIVFPVTVRKLPFWRN